MLEPKPLPAWQIKLFTARQLVREIIDTPSLSPATRLALSGFDIVQNERDSAARSELEISGALRRMR